MTGSTETQVFSVAQTSPRDLMRWLDPDGRCEIWTGERWIDLERDVLKPLAKFHDEMEARR